MSAGDGSGHRLGVETPSGEAGPFPQHDEAGRKARELQPTGLSEDGSFLLLVAADDRGKQFRVRADERLRGLTRGAAGRPNPYQPRADSALTPREIQARLRAGQTAMEVARAAGVPVERIQRYEAPVLAERGRVVEQAQTARPPVRAEEPRRPLGEIVAERLGQRGISQDAVQWDASRRVDGAWTIQMTFPRDETTVTASWLWDPAVGRVRPHDDEAAALLEPLTTRPATPVMPAASRPATFAAPAAGVGPATPSAGPAAGPAAGPTAAAAPSATLAAPGPAAAPSPAAAPTPAATPTPTPALAGPAAASARAEAEPPAAAAVEPPASAKAEPSAAAATATPPPTEAVPLTLVPNAVGPDDSDDAEGGTGGLRTDRRAGSEGPGPTEEVPRKSTPTRATSRRGRREVPAWDDIVFGAKGG